MKKQRGQSKQRRTKKRIAVDDGERATRDPQSHREESFPQKEKESLATDAG